MNAALALVNPKVKAGNGEDDNAAAVLLVNILVAREGCSHLAAKLVCRLGLVDEFSGVVVPEHLSHLQQPELPPPLDPEAG